MKKAIVRWRGSGKAITHSSGEEISVACEPTIQMYRCHRVIELKLLSQSRDLRRHGGGICEEKTRGLGTWTVDHRRWMCVLPFVSRNDDAWIVE